MRAASGNLRAPIIGESVRALLASERDADTAGVAADCGGARNAAAGGSCGADAQMILAGEASDLELAALLGALAARGETPAEVAGFVVAMREVAQGLPLTDAEREGLVDTCGTGGDASGSFNVSTAAALVAAAAGATVAKHGNRAVTSAMRVCRCAGGAGRADRPDWGRRRRTRCASIAFVFCWRRAITRG